VRIVVCKNEASFDSQAIQTEHGRIQQKEPKKQFTVYCDLNHSHPEMWALVPKWTRRNTGTSN
jgi:hypothetical protein